MLWICKQTTAHCGVKGKGGGRGGSVLADSWIGNCSPVGASKPTLFHISNDVRSPSLKFCGYLGFTSQREWGVGDVECLSEAF